MAPGRTETRISISNLAVGMYVSRLDRPWLETPFLVEGLLIDSADEIERIRRYCKYVYVDIDKGMKPARNLAGFKPPRSSKPEEAADEYKKMRKTEYREVQHFLKEIPIAEAVYHDLSAKAQFVMRQLQAGYRFELGLLTKDIQPMLDSVLRNPSALLWVNRLKQAKSYLYHHLVGVSIWCAVFGRHLGLDRHELEDLAIAGLLIDLGKSKLPSELLETKRELTEEEFALMQSHVDHGVRILAQAGSLSSNVLRAVATHHERWDGSGYPMRLKGDRVPVYGRILGLIDSYEAMTSLRPHHPGKSPHDAISELYEYRGTLFQPELVEHFIHACGIFPIGSLVELNSGEVALVIGLDSRRRLRPKVMVLLDAEKHVLPRFISIDLAQERPDLIIRQGLPPGAFGLTTSNLFL